MPVPSIADPYLPDCTTEFQQRRPVKDAVSARQPDSLGFEPAPDGHVHIVSGVTRKASPLVSILRSIDRLKPRASAAPGEPHLHDAVAWIPTARARTP